MPGTLPFKCMTLENDKHNQYYKWKLVCLQDYVLQMTRSFNEHQTTNTFCKPNTSICGVSTDIFIRVDTFSVFSLAQIFVLIRFCLLKPSSQSTEEIGTVRANVSNFSIWGTCSWTQQLFWHSLYWWIV